MAFRLETAKLSHAKSIHSLIVKSAGQDEMLPRALVEIYESIRDFVVAIDDNGNLIGCCALHIIWEDLAEVRSLVVIDITKRNGVGGSLVKSCVESAKALGIKRVFALTYVTAFFQKNGFHIISKDELPHKVWSDCVRCHKFPDCDEQAVALDL